MLFAHRGVQMFSLHPQPITLHPSQAEVLPAQVPSGQVASRLQHACASDLQ